MIVIMLLLSGVNTGSGSASATVGLRFIFPERDSLVHEVVDTISTEEHGVLNSKEGGNVDTLMVVRVYVDSAYYEIKLRKGLPDSIISAIVEKALPLISSNTLR